MLHLQCFYASSMPAPFSCLCFFHGMAGEVFSPLLHGTPFILLLRCRRFCGDARTCVRRRNVHSSKRVNTCPHVNQCPLNKPRSHQLCCHRSLLHPSRFCPTSSPLQLKSYLPHYHLRFDHREELPLGSRANSVQGRRTELQEFKVYVHLRSIAKSFATLLRTRGLAAEEYGASSG